MLLHPDGRFRFIGHALADLSDTVAVVELMDLIITIDTIIAHRTGVTVKSVWILFLGRQADVDCCITATPGNPPLACSARATPAYGAKSSATSQFLALRRLYPQLFVSRHGLRLALLQSVVEGARSRLRMPAIRSSLASNTRWRTAAITSAEVLLR